jgi:ATP-binding cassette subfamily B protein
VSQIPGFIPPPRGDVSQLLRLAGFLTPYRGRIAVALVALVVAASCVLALGQGMRQVVDAGFMKADPHLLNLGLIAVVGMAFILAVATWTRFYFMMTVSERVIADLRRAVFAHVVGLSPAFFDSMRTGEIASRLTNDTEQLRQVIGFGFSMLLRNGLMMIGALVLLFLTSVKLAALIVLGVPATVIPILFIGRRVRRLSRVTQDRVADVSAHVDESLHEIRTVQAYGHEGRTRDQFNVAVEAAYETSAVRVRMKAWLISLVMLIGFCSIGVIMWIGGNDVFAGRLTVGQLSAFVFYAAVVASGAGTVSEVWGEIQKAAGATERLMELLDTRSVLAPASPVIQLPPRVAGAIRFDEVMFSYPTRPEHVALGPVWFDVRPGERVALVGPSGAGKSTVFGLLLRFYDPSAGRVLIDGADIRHCDALQLRSAIALVPQDPVIFATSVAENVRFGRPDASAEEVRAACAAAHALEFIEQLPQGFETNLGERGVKLSGGQRQRISIARALLADRPILLLDEATSSLDAESERQVAQALERLTEGRTTLVIAHRLATVRTADRIIVLERGRIHAAGTHQTLLQEDGLYAHLARLQFMEGEAA